MTTLYVPALGMLPVALGSWVSYAPSVILDNLELEVGGALSGEVSLESIEAIVVAVRIVNEGHVVGAVKIIFFPFTVLFFSYFDLSLQL